LQATPTGTLKTAKRGRGANVTGLGPKSIETLLGSAKRNPSRPSGASGCCPALVKPGKIGVHQCDHPEKKDLETQNAHVKEFRGFLMARPFYLLLLIFGFLFS
jgi:hypothetical protein